MMQERPKTREELAYEQRLRADLERWMKGDVIPAGMEGLADYHAESFGHKFDLAAEVEKETANRNAKVNNGNDERE